MDQPAPPVYTLIMARSTSTKPSLSTLPVELLDQIFQLVDDPDLISLRSVSKSVCAVASRPFAVRNFTTCYHVVTRPSFETLLAISAHSIFGSYIKRITLCPAYAILRYHNLYNLEDEHTVVDDSFVRSGKFSVLIQQILANIGQHSNSVTISIHEDFHLERGPHDTLFEDTPRQLYHGERAIRDNFCGSVYKTSETLELVLAEMRVAEIDINGLELNSIHRNSGYATKLKSYKVVTKFLESRGSPINLCLTWDGNGVLEYNFSQKRLCFSNSSLLLDPAVNRPDALFIKETVRWLVDSSFSELCLRDLDVNRLSYLDVYFTQSIETLTLEDIKLGSVFLAQGVYSALFQRLSGLPNLKHCKFHRLHYALPSDGRSDIQLISGRYESKWSSLLLIFPDGKFELEIQGADILGKLEDLAAYTAAAEERKVREIEAAGVLTEYRIMGADAPILEEQDPEYGVTETTA